ncbi:TfoX/Sxy family protein [Cellulomonas endophytica]|uniref:TfoX/Sxy family protein n=1 Tax=Cellulomonas endophytica TaxID=2494735 RepID=UPI0010102053|nr:TfoX/Sxy family protein [Cellulomonas endophytica]
MAYDESLLRRVQRLTAHHEDRVEKRMFSGVAVMLGDVMAVAVLRDGLLVRVEPDQLDELLGGSGTQPFVMGRQEPAKGWVVVVPEAVPDDDELARWVDLGVARARLLAALPGAGARRSRR